MNGVQPIWASEFDKNIKNSHGYLFTKKTSFKYGLSDRIVQYLEMD